MKKLYFLLMFMIMVIPFSVFAEDDYDSCTSNLEGNLIMECVKTTLVPGETTSCSVKGNITKGATDGLNFTLSTSDDSNLVIGEEMTYDPFWTQSSMSRLIVVNNLEGKTKSGEFDIMKFFITASKNMTTGATIKLNASNINVRDDGTCSKFINDISKEIRIASNVDTLQKIAISGAELSPAFDENTFKYSATVDAEKVLIEVTTKSQFAIVGGLPSDEVTLKYGANNFDINVTSEAGTKKTYSLVINRIDNRDNDNTLSSLKINDVEIKLDKTKFEYTYEVENNVTEAKVVATLSSKLATLEEGALERKVKLSEGKNKVIFKVVAENEEELIYTININRKGISNPKTGSSFIFITLGILVFSLIAGVCMYEYQKMKKVNKI